MTDQPRPLVHIGMAKAASTFLQRIGSDVGEIWFGQLARTYARLCGGRCICCPSS